MNCNRFILGTVQLGLKYGINNKSGKPTLNQSYEILSLANDNEIGYLDTAANYGDSQKIIGEFLKAGKGNFKISTKFTEVDKDFETTVRKTIEQLSVSEIEYYFFHSFDEYLESPEIKSNLLKLKVKGLIKKVGVSVYLNDQIDIASNDKDIDVIQVPFNLLDNETQRADSLRLAKCRGKEIHARSTFLQGIFFMNPSELPEKLVGLRGSIEEINNLSKKYNLSLIEMAFNYPLSKDYIDKIVFGVETTSQLKTNLDASKITLPSDLVAEIDRIASPTKLLNPTNW